MAHSSNKETWNSQMGVILAVAGSAVGLGNFLRFPGQAAQYGGGAFMIAYFVSFLIIGLPIGWAEWTMGRYAGRKGFHSSPGIAQAIWKHPLAKYVGIIGVIIPTVVYTFYVYVQGWCLGYAVNFLTDELSFNHISESQSFWAYFVGITENGSAMAFGFQKVSLYVLIAFGINFFLIYKGLNKGIELFAKWAMPVLIGLGLIILIRVLTLGTPVEAHPENSVSNGLGFMWNPNKVVLESYSADSHAWITEKEIIGSEWIAESEALVQANLEQYRLKTISFIDQLKRPQLWLSAASQLFLSLCIGTGVINVFASYMKKDDDVVLSNLTSTSANEFCEVALGGLITIPAGYAFLGAAGIAGQGVFGLGFNALPMIFSQMPLGWLFGFLFFFLLFIAAVSSVLSMLQPGLAFFGEALGLSRNKCLLLLLGITTIGTSLVFWFTEDLKVMDTLNFWGADFLIFIFATAQILLFGWVFGVNKGFEEANRGAVFRIPRFFKPIVKIICPAFMLSIFFLWLLIDVFGVTGGGLSYFITDLVGSKTTAANPVAWIGIGNIIGLFILYGLFARKAKAYKTIK